MNDELRSEVLGRRYGGQSGRDIARDLHLSRKTVAKVLVEHRQQRANGTTGLPKPRENRGSLVDPYEATLLDYLARYPDMSAVRLLEELRHRGYAGGYTVLRQRVKQLRQQCHRAPVERFETGPGLQAQMDWAVYTVDFTQEGRRKVNLFSYVLGYSRRQYIHFTASQDLETTLREHVRAFEHLQGSATTCLYDNMKVVVLVTRTASRSTTPDSWRSPRTMAFGRSRVGGGGHKRRVKWNGPSGTLKKTCSVAASSAPWNTSTK